MESDVCYVFSLNKIWLSLPIQLSFMARRAGVGVDGMDVDGCGY